eukprot:TRINITY_DN18770_c0_g1_i1.p1 TRINITY_DN18770_c0_g1~~TRINITY_DN18770_c0_g1_i1.p1  ORF type:complete len:359 (-),score=145.73 TRINITY_DN18770_c0_g1_i1:190-1266(-)
MSEWVAICGEEGDAPIEIETEDDGVLLLESVTAHYPGTTTLKYWNKDKTAMRGVKCIEGKMASPTGGWEQASLYICVNPTKVDHTVKRKAESQERDSVTPAKIVKQQQDPEFDPEATIDLILLGLNPQTTETTVRECFEKRGEVSMVQMKKSKDANVGYAFIRFVDKEVERMMVKEKHSIEGKQAYLKIPNSQQGDRSERKVYVSYHTQDLTVEDIRSHFEKYGDVEDVFIPTPWRHFCFVTFTERRVARALLDKEHMLKGVSMLIKSLTSNKEKDKMQTEPAMGMMPSYGMGSMGMVRDGDRQSGIGMGGRGMGMMDGARGETGGEGSGWPGHDQYGTGQVFGRLGYSRGFGGNRRY